MDAGRVNQSLPRLAASVAAFGSLLFLSLAGCAPRSAAAPRERVLIRDNTRFVISDGLSERPFTPWGFNYDRTALDHRDVLLEDVLDQDPGKVETDFAAMARRGGNVARVFVATSYLLDGPQQVNDAHVARVREMMNAAHRQGIRLIVVGLANIRPATEPAWMRDADDDTMLAAAQLFWRTLARTGRDAPGIFAYDIINEPVIHYRDSTTWTDGCFDMPSGGKFCYIHRPYRQPERRWTRFVHERYPTPEALRAHWPDFPRAGESWDAIAVPEPTPKDRRYGEFIAFHGQTLHDWADRMRDAIRSEDRHHLITLGALDPRPVADLLDFCCLHLYPQVTASADTFADVNRREWRRQLDRAPADKPVIIEEMFPLHLSPGVSQQDYLNLFLEVTRPRVAGWVSFYWGEPDTLPASNPFANAIYEAWLKTWGETSEVETSKRQRLKTSQRERP